TGFHPTLPVSRSPVGVSPLDLERKEQTGERINCSSVAAYGALGQSILTPGKRSRTSHSSATAGVLTRPARVHCLFLARRPPHRLMDGSLVLAFTGVPFWPPARHTG